VGAVLFHADGRTDMSRLIVGFCNFPTRLKIINIVSSLRKKVRRKKELSSRSEVVENLSYDITHTASFV